MQIRGETAKGTTDRRELDIERPDGTVETVDVSAKWSHLNDVLVAAIAKATAEGGRGQVLRYRNVVEDRPEPAATCDRCGVEVDRTTAYHQQERMRVGSASVKITAYYCAACSGVLHAVGMGESSAMAQRADNVVSTEPVTKED